MRSAGNSTNPSPEPPPIPPGLDLEVYSEATRRALYDVVVAVHFRPSADSSPADWVPDYSPDQAGLTVFFLHGRWLASWSRLEEAASDLPPSRRHALVRIQAAPEAPNGVMFYEV
jgi:hypothetical protein